MMPAKNLTGAAFGRLSVISRVMDRPKERPTWRCECACGSIVAVCTPDLTRGRVRSCGCWQREGVAERNRQRRTHGHATEGQETPTYNSWTAMHQRCANPNHTTFARYGGRGITVCD